VTLPRQQSTGGGPILTGSTEKRVEIDRESVDRCEIDRDLVDCSGGYVKLTPLKLEDLKRVCIS